MSKKNNVTFVPFIIPITIQSLTIYLAYKVIEYLNKLSNIPQCKNVEPATREALNVYSYFIVITSILNIMLWIYIYFNSSVKK